MKEKEDSLIAKQDEVLKYLTSVLTMAEAFADVYGNGDNTNPLSIEIKRLTLEKIEEYKGRR